MRAPTPYIEINALQFYAEKLPGLYAAAVVCPSMLIASEPPAVDAVYSQLARDLPGTKIVPGIKTNGALAYDLGNVAGWETIARAVGRACELTGSDECLIDNELGWQLYRKGLREPTWAHVRRGLMQLPPKVRYIWYPAVTSLNDTPAHLMCQARERTFIRTMTDVVDDVTLVTFQYGGPDAIGNPRAAERYAINCDFGCPTVPIVWAINGRAWYWSHDELPSVLDRVDRRALVNTDRYQINALWRDTAKRIAGRVSLSAARAAVELRAATEIYAPTDWR